ncbi:MAG: CRISPR-associated helicase Cas3' [bacterium]|nr:CRISPR-associated helicase Cas3' [bacterium]
MGGLWDNAEFRAEFLKLTGHQPYPYQERVARELLAGRHVVVTAPTGAGKTWAALVPFLVYRKRYGWNRLIYTLPLRTLVQGVHRQAGDSLVRLGIDPERATIQTGEEPNDPFFDGGEIVVTTYDQLLSGMLCSPYGLSGRQHNVNAAALVGSVIVFDEFHLMEATRAFLTAVAGVHLFRDLTQVLWMTATATRPARDLIRSALPATREISLSAGELASLPAVASVRRKVIWEERPLTTEAVTGQASRRTLVICNTVARAQAFYRQLLAAGNLKVPVMLLHGAFFTRDRKIKEQELMSRFGENGNGSGILVATQVIEAGLNLSCDHLHTEVCPMNSLVQRAGRCARFPKEDGVVHVYPLPDGAPAAPYAEAVLDRTASVLHRQPETEADPTVASMWVKEVHSEEDAQALRGGWCQRLTECVSVVHRHVVLRQPSGVAHLIRDGSDSVRVLVAHTPPESPGDLEGVSLSRRRLYALLKAHGEAGVGWYWDGQDEVPWKPLRSPDLSRTYAVCLPPSVAAYDDEVGLRLGEAGEGTSPARRRPPRPGHRPLRAESWLDHSHAVTRAALGRLERDRVDAPWLTQGWKARTGLGTEGIYSAVQATAVLHDLGKLQRGWQAWAGAVQAMAGGWAEMSPLAHTDFDGDDPEHCRRVRQAEQTAGRRPPHSGAGAYYACLYLPQCLTPMGASVQPHVTSACVAAILAHHGGWLPGETELAVQPLVDAADRLVANTLGIRNVGNDMLLRWAGAGDRKGLLEALLDLTTSLEGLPEWWPLVAYLVRTLRLADRGATREGSEV